MNDSSCTVPYGLWPQGHGKFRLAIRSVILGNAAASFKIFRFQRDNTAKVYLNAEAKLFKVVGARWLLAGAPATTLPVN